MSAVTHWVARYTPLFLILFAVGAVIATAVAGGPLLENAYYACWLIVAAALLVRLDHFLETRK